ncbi:MAG: M20/M25/M40 family metallo-hydrolase, partial [Anaerolineales bacterium]
MRSTNLPESLYASGTYLQITQLRIQEYLTGLSRTLFFFGNVFAMFLLGLYVGKRRIFQEVDQHLTLLHKTLIVGLLVGVICHGLWVWSTIHPTWLPLDWIPVEYSRMLQRAYYTIGAPAIMLFYVSGIILILRIESIYNHLAPLGNVGRMALSNYLLQSIIATLIFYNYGLGLFGQISPAFGLILTVVIFLAQIKFSEWWFDRHKFGPVERLWRMLTYLKWQTTRFAEQSKGYPNPRFQTLNRIYSKIGPYGILILIWTLLIIWGAILVSWYAQLEKRSIQALTQIIAENSSSQSLSTPISHGDPEESAISNKEFVTIPKVNPVTYTPSRLAASGDVLALVETFDINQALNEIKVLSSDQFEGRPSGAPGGEAAGNYIADIFTDSGLQPLGIDGTYFQPFTVTYTPLETIPKLMVVSSDNSLNDKYKLFEDYSPIIKWYAGPGSGTGKVFWAVNCGDDDFAGFDVVGKIVMCNPGSGDNWLAEISRNALESGASGLLLIADPSIRPPDMGSTIKDVWVPEPIPTFWIYPNVIEDILMGSTISVSDISSKEDPQHLESTVSFDVKTKETDSCPGKSCIARNVIGILPGRDPTYSDEAVILGAHYDHLGQAPDGTIWRGANDNASGIAVLLEIAQRWHKYGYVPRRTVIFAAWDAEEIGLIGSSYYVNQPTYPLDETIAMIQLDMVGAGGEILGIDGNKDLSEQIRQAAETYGIQTEFTSIGRSDHVPFLSAGVPASLLIWREDETSSPHYHRPADTLSIIEPQQLKAAAQITELT